MLFPSPATFVTDPTVLWGYAMQTFGYAATIPLYAAAHLFTSSAFTSSGKALEEANTLRNRNGFALRVLVPAFAIGYLVPTVLMCYPVTSPAFHRWLSGIWQGFPLCVVIWQRVCARLAGRILQNSAQTISRAYG